jgi:hypothetical protein
MRSLGYCAIFMVLYLFFSVIVIVGPLMSGNTVRSELKSYAFNTPARAPIEENLLQLPSSLG